MDNYLILKNIYSQLEPKYWNNLILNKNTYVLHNIISTSYLKNILKIPIVLDKHILYKLYKNFGNKGTLVDYIIYFTERNYNEITILNLLKFQQTIYSQDLVYISSISTNKNIINFIFKNYKFKESDLYYISNSSIYKKHIFKMYYIINKFFENNIEGDIISEYYSNLLFLNVVKCKKKKLINIYLSYNRGIISYNEALLYLIKIKNINILSFLYNICKDGNLNDYVRQRVLNALVENAI